MIPFRINDYKRVSEAEMQDIYQKIATPKKIGAVMKWTDDFTDSPTVFRKDGAFYMYYVAISKDCSKYFYCAVNDKNERFIALATS